MKSFFDCWSSYQRKPLRGKVEHSFFNLLFQLQLFHDGGLYDIETSSLICSADQWTGFYIIGISVMKELNLRKRTLWSRGIYTSKYRCFAEYIFAWDQILNMDLIIFAMTWYFKNDPQNNFKNEGVCRPIRLSIIRQE